MQDIIIFSGNSCLAQKLDLPIGKVKNSLPLTILSVDNLLVQKIKSL